MTEEGGDPGEVVVGLDVGTTGVKAVAFAPGSSWRRVAIREYPLLQPAPGREVQDPDAIVTAAGEALAECLGATGTAEVAAVSVSAAMHGLIALDAELRPLTPLVTWADTRAREEAGRLWRSGAAGELHVATGAPVHPMTPLTKLMWFARHEPGVWASARWWVGLKDYVLLWLTGTLVTEVSSASATGLLDMSTRSWSSAALDVSGVAAERLPPILAPTAMLPLAPATARQLGLPAGTPVVVGAADGPLANLGTGAIVAGVAGLSLGTSGAVRLAVDEPQVDAGHKLFCYALTDAAWIVGGAFSNGGAVARWAGHSLAPDLRVAAGDAGPDEAVLRLAESVPPGSDGLLMVPCLLPERSPVLGPDVPGAYVGLRREHTRAHLVRAAVEGVCLHLRAILDELDRLHPVSAVHATGGTFRSPLWQDVATAVLDRPLYVMADAEGTALGAAALALVALGRAPGLVDAVAQLSAPDSPAPSPSAVTPDLVETYARLRASLPELIAALAPAGRMFDGPGR